MTDEGYITTLCGSVRLGKDIWDAVAQDFTLSGHIVLTVNVWGQYDHLHSEEGQKTKELLDRIHKKKIELSDQVIILKKDDYIGESTRSELEHAMNLGKPVGFIDVDHWVPASILCADLRREKVD